MNFETETFLPTTVTEPQQILLPFGLIGLGELREFELRPMPDSWPFLILLSRGQMEIEFLAAEARNVVSNYSVELNDEDAESLGLANPEDAMLLTLVTVHSLKPQFVTVNLLGPIIVNRKTLIGKQIVLPPREKHSTAYPLIDERPGSQPPAPL